VCSVEIRHKVSNDGSFWQDDVVPACVGCSRVYWIHLVRECVSFYVQISDFFIGFEEKVPGVWWCKDFDGGLLSWLKDEILVKLYWLAKNLLRGICFESADLKEMYFLLV